MRRSTVLAVLATALALASDASALPHGDDDMHMGGEMSHSDQTSADSPMSYFAYGKHTGTIITHVALMILGWCFVLPAGVMLSVARSRLALPTQFLFLIVNTLGMLLGIIYNNQTPDLYPNNAHHKIGWIASSVACAQVVMLLIFTYAGRGDADVAASERAAFIPVSMDEMPHHSHYHSTGEFPSWSRHSGQGTERYSIYSGPSSSTCISSSADDVEFDKPEEDDLHGGKPAGSRSWLRNTFVDRFLASRVPGMVSSRVLSILHVVYMVIDRILLPFGFIAIATGGVTYGGIMRGVEIFNGLAHFIKGGIFFWYGLLTLGRWMGCWSDFGWSWNVKPPAEIVGKAKVRIPSAEFVESLVIFLYGVTNVFLEHLSGWGGAWTPRDLEHVSISVLFFGGGLCGMLFESKRVRNWVNTTVLQDPSQFAAHKHIDSTWQVPSSQRVSLNPMPALVILLLGTMMGSHHQDSMVSSMVHQQWGNLLTGFAVSRILTYVILFLKPPTSYLPSRPPTEVLASFCLVGGGLIFMMSTRDIVETMIYYEIDSMFTMTVGMGLTAFVMAWEVCVIAIKAWAMRREMAPQVAAL